VAIKGNANNATKTRAMANTPPVLFGILRKMQYTIKKYHSGTILKGVTKLLAGMLLSGWASRFGVNHTKILNITEYTRRPTRSL
jgi:hypothetical protein